MASQSPSALSATPLPSPLKETKEPQKRKPPTAEELVAHYESQGFDSKEASLKVIQDLQTILFRVAGPGRTRKEKFMAETNRKLDNANTRLAILEMKVDLKPGFVESMAIGVTSGAIVNGVAGAIPHVFRAFSQIWSSVKSSTRS